MLTPPTPPRIGALYSPRQGIAVHDTFALRVSLCAAEIGASALQQQFHLLWHVGKRCCALPQSSHTHRQQQEKACGLARMRVPCRWVGSSSLLIVLPSLCQLLCHSSASVSGAFCTNTSVFFANTDAAISGVSVGGSAGFFWPFGVGTIGVPSTNSTPVSSIPKFGAVRVDFSRMQQGTRMYVGCLKANADQHHEWAVVVKACVSSTLKHTHSSQNKVQTHK